MNRIIAIVTAVVFLAVAVIMAGSITGTFAPAPTVTPTPTPAPTPTPTPPPTARATAVSTEAAAVPIFGAVSFTGTEGMENITWEAPDVLRIGGGWGGTYTAAWEVNLTNTTGSDVNIGFGLEVDGSIVAATEAYIFLHPGETMTLSKSTDIPIPAGASVRLLNVSWMDAAELTNAVPGGRSAVLRLERIGP